MFKRPMQHSNMFWARIFFFFFIVSLGFAHSVVERDERPTSVSLDSTIGSKTMNDLFKGNERFRNATAKRASVARMVEEAPSFMFLGCTDNRLSPASIFQTPIGSIITQNNIANQYSKDDVSTDAAITYAIESLGVQHIIVMGHYGCTGVQKAIVGSKTDNPVTKWIRPVAELYRTTRRDEITKLRDSRMPRRGQPSGVTGAPEADDPGFHALVEENVRQTVQALKEQSLLAKAYQRSAKMTVNNSPIEVYVHGFVFNDFTRQVMNLNVSFGPLGKTIPSIPFAALAAARNFHRQKYLPSYQKGKTL